LLATITLLVLRQIDAKEVTVATTFEATGANGSRVRPDVAPQLVEHVQAYLRSLRLGGRPDPGLRRAWEDFYRLHRPLVDRVVGAFRLSEQDAEDCVQEVWTAIIGRLPHFERDPSRGRFCSWLARLIHNQVIDFVRKASRRDARLVALPEGTPANRNSDPVAAFRRSERRRLVRHVLEHLQQQVSETNYRLAYLRWVEGQDVPTVAGDLGLTSQQVWYRHHRVKKRLRRLLEAHSVPQ
jgi:RNA polymerase sigma factor (sigma-70 family)